MGWTKLKEFVGFIFNWKDVVETKNSISAVLTATLEAADSWVEQGQNKVNDVFENIERAIQNFGNFGIPEDVSTADAVKGNQQSSCSTSATWALERLKNGGPGPEISDKGGFQLLYCPRTT